MGAPIMRGGTGGPPWGKGSVGQVYAPSDRPPFRRVPGPSGSGARWRPEFVLGTAYMGHRAFDYDAGATLPLPFTTQDTSAVGSPTLDFSADAADGAYVMKLATTNEVEKITLYWGDQLTIDITKKPILFMRLKVESDVTGAGGAFAAGDILVAGLASARNATLDSVSINAWFRFEGANHNILCETDDNTTDNDDNDTGSDWTENTYMDLVIDCSDLSNVKFILNDANITPERMDLSAASGNVQPFIELQKAAAANKDHRVTVRHIAWQCASN